MNTPVLQFVWQGKMVSLPGVPATRTLLQLLCEDLDHSATKEGCSRGDGGACTVVLGEPRGQRLHYRAINSCIRLAHSIHGLALWTAADLRDGAGLLHPVQQAMHTCHASQCGFCTPGMVMRLFGLYQNQIAQDQPLTRALALEALAGNLSPCTGYQALFEAAELLSHLPRTRSDEAGILQLLARIPMADPELASDYLAPLSLPDLLAARARHPHARLLAGGTDLGPWLNQQSAGTTQLLDLSRVAELNTMEVLADRTVIGAAVPLSEAFAELQAERPPLHPYLSRFGGLQFRQAGTLGGNIVNGSPVGDTMPLLIALGASLVLLRQGGRREIPIEAFDTGYRQNILAPDEVLAFVHVPRPAPDEFLRAYQVSVRLEADVATVSLALRLQLRQGRVAQISIGAGGVAATPQRATRTEQALRGQDWTQASVNRAIAVLRDEFEPISDLRASADYRRTVLGHLLQRFWHQSQGQESTELAVPEPLP